MYCVKCGTDVVPLDQTKEAAESEEPEVTSPSAEKASRLVDKKPSERIDAVAIGSGTEMRPESKAEAIGETRKAERTEAVSSQAVASSMRTLWTIFLLVTGGLLFLIINGSGEAQPDLEASYAADEGIAHFLGKTLLLPIWAPVWLGILIGINSESAAAYVWGRALALFYFALPTFFIFMGFIFVEPGAATLFDSPNPEMAGYLLWIGGGLLVLLGIIQYGAITQRELAAFFGVACLKCGHARLLIEKNGTYKCEKCSFAFTSSANARYSPPQAQAKADDRRAPSAGEWQCRCGNLNPETTNVCEKCKRHRDAIY